MQPSKYAPFRKKSLRIWIGLGIALVALLLVGRLYFWITDDFRVSNIIYSLPHHQEWEIPAQTQEEENQLAIILDQKFTYIGKGAQSYVFGSADGKYVIKFFKFKHLKPAPLMTLVPNIAFMREWKEREAQRKEKKLNSVFDGYRLAWEKERIGTGLVFIQLNVPYQQRFFTVIDKIGLERTIDLGEVPYIIQKRGETLRTVLTRSLNKGDIPLVKQYLGQIIDLYLSEYQMGIYDRDHGVAHNTGFVGDKPIHLDVGKLSPNIEMQQPEVYQADFAIVVNKMVMLIKKNYPQYYPEVAAYVEQRTAKIMGRPFKLTPDAYQNYRHRKKAR